MLETKDQNAVRATVRKLAASEIPHYQDERFYGRVPRELFELFAKQGFTGLSIPEEFGGMGAGAQTTAIVMEEIAAVDLGPAIFLSVHCMVSGLISRFGTLEQKKRYLPRLASGELLGAFALSEPQAGSDAAALRLQAKKSRSGYLLSGEKSWITSAGFADLYLVFARIGPGTGRSGITAFLVESEVSGMSYGQPEEKMGCELSPIASITFEGSEVSADALLGSEDGGYSIALAGLAGGRVNIAACAVGLSSAALDRAVKHLQERTQFNQKLIEFQGLQFMLADMYSQLEASRLLTWKAARELEQDPSSRFARLDPAVAKCFATDAAMRITTDAVQLLGAAGYVREYQVERYMRDAKMLQIVEGTNQIQRLIIARELSGA